jgi:peptidoglycan/xylan/chitin deacetylase (PgdA/CDA1 family)
MVADEPVPHLQHYRYLSSAEFEADVCCLKDHFGFMGYDQLLERRLRGSSVRDNRALITFDDGFAQCASVVRPILLRHSAPCIFFVTTDLIDNRVMFRESQASLCIDEICRQPVVVIEKLLGELGLDAQLLSPSMHPSIGMNSTPINNISREPKPPKELEALLHWLLNASPNEAGLVDRLTERLGIDTHAYLTKVEPYLTTRQIRQLQEDGFTIGAHSCSHRFLQNLPAAEAEREIVESCRIIRDLTGQPSVPFAFPLSGVGLDRAWLASIRQRNDFIGLFFSTGGLGRDVPFVISRVGADRATGSASIRNRLRQAWAGRPAWHRSG